jgi:hypothetical protein
VVAVDDCEIDRDILRPFVYTCAIFEWFGMHCLQLAVCMVVLFMRAKAEARDKSAVVR